MDTKVSYELTDLLAKIDAKIDLISSQLGNKADREFVLSIEDRVQTLETDKIVHRELHKFKRGLLVTLVAIWGTLMALIVELVGGKL